MESPSNVRLDEQAAAPGQPSRELARRLRSALLQHFDAHARDLPWRRTGDPYAIWVSEVMLQQTQVATVVPYYVQWMERFPDVRALAESEQDDVLKAWEGLGYYRRARNLHRGAQQLCEAHGAELPSTAKALRRLPGVGEYTAGAVASIAFGEAQPAVDGNVRRVLARLFDWPDPSAAGLRRLAGALVDPERPGDFNQALMELGATICTPLSPRCGDCPVASECRGLAAGTENERPAPKPRARPRNGRFVVGVLARRSSTSGRWHLAIQRRPADGMLGGMWEFPGSELSVGESARYARRRLATTLGVDEGTTLVELAPVRHVYSHLLAQYMPFLVRLTPDWSAVSRTNLCWANQDEVAGLPLPNAQRIIGRSALERLAANAVPG